MKSKHSGWRRSILLAGLLPVLGGCMQNVASAPDQPQVYQNTALTSAVSPASNAPTVVLDPPPPPVAEVPSLTATAPAPGTNLEPNALAAPAEEPGVVSAPAKPVTERVTPANVKLNQATSELLRMVDAGVEEGVLLAYVTNSSTIFNLGADEIIYLNDLGVPSSVVTAVIQHDQALKGEAAAAADAAAIAAAAAATNPPPGTYAPAEVAAQPEATNTAAYAAPESAPTQASFEQQLSPYGSWIDVDGYGRVWQPTVVVVNRTWTPYYDGGRWIYSDSGWYWYSDYSWGWAPFHYGRWFRHNYYGWCWYPGYVWGPSWVTWRYYGDYCGWAPLPPHAIYRPGFGITYYGSSVGYGFSFGLTPACYSFVHWNHLHGHRYNYGHRVPRHEVDRVFNKTTVVTRISGNNNTIVNRGIAPEQVSKATGTEIRPVALRGPGRDVDTRVRRERLSPDGQSLYVSRPGVEPAVRSPGRPSRTSGGDPVGEGSTRTPTTVTPRERPGTAPDTAAVPLAPSTGNARPVARPERTPLTAPTRTPSGSSAEVTPNAPTPRANPSGGGRTLPPVANTRAPGDERPRVTVPESGGSVQRPTAAPRQINPASPGTETVRVPAQPAPAARQPATRWQPADRTPGSVETRPSSRAEFQGSRPAPVPSVPAPSSQSPARAPVPTVQSRSTEVPRYTPAPVQAPAVQPRAVQPQPSAPVVAPAPRAVTPAPQPEPQREFRAPTPSAPPPQQQFRAPTYTPPPQVQRPAAAPPPTFTPRPAPAPAPSPAPAPAVSAPRQAPAPSPAPRGGGDSGGSRSAPSRGERPR